MYKSPCQKINHIRRQGSLKGIIVKFSGTRKDEKVGLWSWFQSLFSSGQQPPTKGTIIQGVQITNVIDGDTLHVRFDGKDERLRLLSVDTEESQSGGSKPVTKAGKMASEMAKKYFSKGQGWCEVTIEFDTTQPKAHCLEYHRGTYGRLLCYVWKEGENYNEKLIKEGWSPYFVKYGGSRLHDDAYQTAHDKAKSDKLIIWDPKTNEGGPSRDYEALLPWWEARGQRVRKFRESASASGALDVREDYAKIVKAMQDGQSVTVFCDLQQGIHARPGTGAVIYAGSKTHPFNIWIPDADQHKEITDNIEKKYAHQGIGYAYVTGKVLSFKERPQIELTSISQLTENYPSS